MEILIFVAKIWDSKIYDVYCTGTGTGICSFFLVVSGKIVLQIFGTGKKYLYRYRLKLLGAIILCFINLRTSGN